jgi:hypothetical protein
MGAIKEFPTNRRRKHLLPDDGNQAPDEIQAQIPVLENRISAIAPRQFLFTNGFT